ncbi:MAG TPA: hypothetical protein VND94_01010 [Terriglobia bacterium]|nr:hypothetical protein [Terriglobia bacterium]
MLEIGPVSGADQAEEIAKIVESEAIGRDVYIREAQRLQSPDRRIEVPARIQDVKCIPDRPEIEPELCAGKQGFWYRITSFLCGPDDPVVMLPGR